MEAEPESIELHSTPNILIGLSSDRNSGSHSYSSHFQPTLNPEDSFSIQIHENYLKISDKEIQTVTFSPLIIPSETSTNSQSYIKTPRFSNENICPSDEIGQSGRSQGQVNELNYNENQNMNLSVKARIKQDRRGFIVKVYCLLSIQLVITSAFCGTTLAVPQLREGIKATRPVVYVAFVLVILLIISIMCFKRLAKQVPYNYIALFLFTLLESYIVSYICAHYDPLLVVLTALISLSVSLSLTIYSAISKTDFTICGGILISFATSLIIFSILMIFFNEYYVNLILCEITILIYSIFIVYDTQLIAGGRYEEIGLDDYVLGSLILYVDIIGLFVYMLSLCFNKGN